MTSLGSVKYLKRKAHPVWRPPPYGHNATKTNLWGHTNHFYTFTNTHDNTLKKRYILRVWRKKYTTTSFIFDTAVSPTRSFAIYKGHSSLPLTRNTIFNFQTVSLWWLSLFTIIIINIIMSSRITTKPSPIHNTYTMYSCILYSCCILYTIQFYSIQS